MAMDWRVLRRDLTDRVQGLWHALRESLDRLQQASRPTLQRLHERTQRGRSALQQHWAHHRPAWWPTAEAPPGARRIVEVWHQAECWLAVAAFGFIATILLADVIGRELLGPLLRLLGFNPGGTGIFAAQKLSVFALVIGSFAGIGIATASGSHIVPRFAYGWVPAGWGAIMDRLADVLTGLFLVGVAWFGFKFVGSSLKTDLRAPVLDWPVWPVQLFIPLGFLSAAGRYLFYAVWPALRPQPPEFQE
jgi:TRAP-type C4-dicarboxylate transport system permease small subunit